MMTKKHFFILLLLLIIFIIYIIPAKRQNFFKSYKKEDKASKSLAIFKKKPTQEIVINTIKWNYLAYGKGAKTILFIHGMGGAYDLWWQQMEFFKDQYKVISYTLPEEIDNLQDAANGVLKILEKENTQQFYVVGTSMGGYIAQYLTHKIPDRIEKVVFGNTFPPNTVIEKKNKSKSKIIPWLPEILISKLGEQKLNDEIVPAGNNSPLLKAFLPSLPFSKKQFINRYSVVIDKFIPNPSTYKLKRIPKLIIESDNDPLVEKVLREKLKETYTDASVFTFHNQGHFPYINSAQKYNEVLASFFDTTNEYKTLEQTITNYFEGRRNADITLLTKAFDTNAMLFTTKDSSVLKIPLTAYFDKVKQDGKTAVITQILDATIQGEMAVCNTSFEYKTKTYHDYLTLLKVNNKWKITSKNFIKTK